MDTPYCLCGQPYNPNIFMIQCDLCKDWFHGSCVDFQEHLAIEIDKYHCPRCAEIFGPSVYKPWKNWHRHDFWDENATEKPVQTGTAVFIKELRARHFASESEVVIHVRGPHLTDSFLQQRGFDCPIVVDTKEGLDITIPSDSFSLYDVESYIGADHEMDVIDVTRQTDIRMKLRDFVAYFNSLNRTRVFNVVSLEFSSTGLSRMVDAPFAAKKLDWANTVWPSNYHIGRPHVQKYCLMSVKDAYTDFHIDFGGTSVWYHVVWGEKIFYFIKPTPANLTLYQQWMTSTNQSETFFGDQVDRCYKATLRQGQTMFVPTGWIHAVLTPIDSLVFGGNFLHSLNIPMQLQVYDIEKKVKTTEKFLYPNFEMINWFAAQKLLVQINEINAEERRCPSTILVGLKAMLSSLKQWNAEKDYNMSSREQVPTNLNAAKLLKDISKEIRHAERFINSLNPPKPERESKRKRKKPVNKDFVDYSLSAKSDFLLDIPDYQPPLKLTLPKPTVYPFSTSEIMSTQDIRNTLLDDTWNANIRPDPTTTERNNPFLKLKLEPKEFLTPRDTGYSLTPSIGLNFDTLNKSVYDFDDSDRDEDSFNLSIDENPRKSKKQSSTSGSLKMRLPNSWGTKSKKARSEDVQITTELPKNGIESLLKASALTPNFMHEGGTGRTSPSTREAIAGMLSISQTFIEPGRQQARSRKYRTLSNNLSEEEDVNNVHQDEDYIYPSLDNSDDDEVQIFKPRGRSKIDEAWNPKARVGPLLPKMNRPAREGTKKQAVEKVLEAAAAKRASESPEKSPKRQYRRKKVKPKPVDKTSVSSSSSIASTSNVTSTTPRPRKGMKTAKQRLGKILKIHKMIH